MTVVTSTIRTVPRPANLALGVALCVVTLAVVSVLANLGAGPFAHHSSGVAQSAHVRLDQPVRRTADGLSAAWVREENAKPGTDQWHITGHQVARAIEGYADQVSAQRGDTVGLHVSTMATSFRVEAYRMGWYGGLQGRLVWTSPESPGGIEPPPAIDPITNMVEGQWPTTLSVSITSAWVPGDYLLKLVGDAGQASYVPLTVRDDASRATYLVQNSVTTWQAYNLWGGYDLYQGGTGRLSTYANRSRVVSFDRPYDFGFGEGAADFLGNELPMVSQMESEGLDVTYNTDVDTARAPQILLRHRTFISLGHDEYWSSTMRQGAIDAIAHGVNLMFLGANAIFRHVRFASSPLGPYRHQIDYKVASEDPLYGVDNAEVTSDWPNKPDPRPESTIIGDMYDCNPVNAPMVVSDPGSWAFAGTGLVQGNSLDGLVGSEYDRYMPSLPGPQDMQILAHSPVTCHGRPDHSDMTYYTDPSGAGVFATGTNLWVAFLGRGCPPAATTTSTLGDATTSCSGDAARRVTNNVLAAFGVGPAGRAPPAQTNWQTVLGSSGYSPPAAPGTPEVVPPSSDTTVPSYVTNPPSVPAPRIRGVPRDRTTPPSVVPRYAPTVPHYRYPYPTTNSTAPTTQRHLFPPTTTVSPSTSSPGG